MVGWYHRLTGHEFEKAPGDGEGQGSLACCSPPGRKESDRTERLNNNRLWVPDQSASIHTRTSISGAAHPGLQRADAPGSLPVGSSLGEWGGLDKATPVQMPYNLVTVGNEGRERTSPSLSDSQVEPDGGTHPDAPGSPLGQPPPKDTPGSASTSRALSMRARRLARVQRTSTLPHENSARLPDHPAQNPLRCCFLIKALLDQ